MRSGIFWALILTAQFGYAASSSAPPETGYVINDDVLIRTKEGATLSATVVRKAGVAGRLPTLLTFDIYADPKAFIERGKRDADHGYVGVVADARGKRLSPDPIVPYEHEASDTYEVIDWIARQPWSNGRVGMYGGSYLGFAAWSATKRLHPALKTIAVSAAAIPGLGLPMEHNVFLSANYGWAFYVSDNRLLDNELYDQNDRWAGLIEKWFKSGRPYRDIDAIDGKPNAFLHRWLQHPAYDAYWQAMVPYGSDFSRINIPVLTITGYYDDGQISALEYLKQHVANNPRAEHYLVIGPYEHFGTHGAEKAALLRGYAIDPVAQMNTPQLTYQWMDYVLRSGPKPGLLADNINYEVMGCNEWRHAASLEVAKQRELKLYFGSLRQGDHYGLLARKPERDDSIVEVVDLKDRTVENNSHQYPEPIVVDTLGRVTEEVFVSEPFQEATVVSGAFAGVLDIALNKRDADLGVTVFERMADGRYFHLSHWLARASFAADGTRRHLLAPGQRTAIPFETTWVSRRLAKGSQLVVLLDANKNSIAEVNYGTGGDVSEESARDAGEALNIAWHSSSYIRLPLDR